MSSSHNLNANPGGGSYSYWAQPGCHPTNNFATSAQSNMHPYHQESYNNIENLLDQTPKKPMDQNYPLTMNSSQLLNNNNDLENSFMKVNNNSELFYQYEPLNFDHNYNHAHPQYVQYFSNSCNHHHHQSQQQNHHHPQMSEVHNCSFAYHHCMHQDFGNYFYDPHQQHYSQYPQYNQFCAKTPSTGQKIAQNIILQKSDRLQQYFPQGENDQAQPKEITDFSQQALVPSFKHPNQQANNQNQLQQQQQQPSSNQVVISEFTAGESAYQPEQIIPKDASVQGAAPNSTGHFVASNNQGSQNRINFQHNVSAFTLHSTPKSTQNCNNKKESKINNEATDNQPSQSSLKNKRISKRKPQKKATPSLAQTTQPLLHGIVQSTHPFRPQDQFEFPQQNSTSNSALEDPYRFSSDLMTPVPTLPLQISIHQSGSLPLAPLALISSISLPASDLKSLKQSSKKKSSFAKIRSDTQLKTDDETVIKQQNSDENPFHLTVANSNNSNMFNISNKTDKTPSARKPSISSGIRKKSCTSVSTVSTGTTVILPTNNIQFSIPDSNMSQAYETSFQCISQNILPNHHHHSTILTENEHDIQAHNSNEKDLNIEESTPSDDSPQASQDEHIQARKQEIETDKMEQEEKPEKISTQSDRKPCNCDKSKCLKRYCDCFAAGINCTPECQCVECHNLPQYEEERQKAIIKKKKRIKDAFQPVIIDNAHRKGCNCKQSYCKKNYCVCHSNGVICSDLCKCVECDNKKIEMDNHFSKKPPAQDSGVITLFIGGESAQVALIVPPNESIDNNNNNTIYIDTRNNLFDGNQNRIEEPLDNGCGDNFNAFMIPLMNEHLQSPFKFNKQLNLNNCEDVGIATQGTVEKYNSDQQQKMEVEYQSTTKKEPSPANEAKPLVSESEFSTHKKPQKRRTFKSASKQKALSFFNEVSPADLKQYQNVQIHLEQQYDQI